MKKNHKLIIAIHHLKFGGSERAASELANYFNSIGVDVILLLMFSGKIEYKVDNGVKIIKPGIDYKNTSKIYYLFYLLNYLRDNIKKENPKSILALGGKTFVNFSTIGINNRLVYSIRTSITRPRFPDNFLLDLIYNFVNKILSFNVDGVIVQTKRAKKYFKRKSDLEVVAIPNSIRDLNNYSVQRENIILSVGRLSEEKGHKYLIKAFYKANLNGWVLQILGDGPQLNNLKKLVNKLGIKDSVVFEGFKSKVDLYMQKARIFVLPSLYEGFPNALLEAMGNKMACISFDCEMGPSEIIDHGKNGFLVEEKDVKKLAEYLNLLVNDQNLRESLGKEASKVREIYHIKEVGKNYFNFLFKN